MRTRALIATTAVIVAVALLARGMGARQAPTPISEIEFDALMTEVRLTVGDTEQHIDSRYWPETAEDGDRFAEMFEKVQVFWNAREVEDAARIAGEAIAAANALSLAASRNELDGTRAALGELRATCAACHQSYREETDDGYRIKQ
jgi:hypothetical protein